MAKKLPHPYIKWVGGKARISDRVLSKIPSKINNYYEPFLGGGAIFFDLYKRGSIQKATLGDFNPELMNSYRVVRDNVEDLIKYLKKPKYEYKRKSYLNIREQNPLKLSSIERAARFIYLNRTCFNGLYRVNNSGQFNVPFGDYRNPVICDEVNLKQVSIALNGVRLLEEDFTWVLELAKPGDVVYLDPPYIPLSKTSKFDSYTRSGFGLDKHEELANTFKELSRRKVRVILSNSSAPESYAFYKGFKIEEFENSRSVGGPANYRKSVKELLISVNC